MPERNYKFEKRQKDLAKQKKKEEKLRRKQAKDQAPKDNTPESSVQGDRPASE